MKDKIDQLKEELSTKTKKSESHTLSVTLHILRNQRAPQ